MGSTSDLHAVERQVPLEELEEDRCRLTPGGAWRSVASIPEVQEAVQSAEEIEFSGWIVSSLVEEGCTQVEVHPLVCPQIDPRAEPSPPIREFAVDESLEYSSDPLVLDWVSPEGTSRPLE